MKEINPHLLGECKMLLNVLRAALPKTCARCKVKGATPGELLVEMILELEDEGMAICAGAYAHIHSLVEGGTLGHLTDANGDISPHN